MVEKEGTSGEKDALKAYKAARDGHEHITELDEGDDVSSALIEKVRPIFLVLKYHWDQLSIFALINVQMPSG